MPEELNPTMTQNFIHDFIDEDIAQGGQYEGMTVHTRFPPEPNGYLHIGHCKALTIDFGTAEKYGCAVLLSGREDVAAGEGMTRVIRGGSQAMGLITGTGCMLSVLCGAFAAVAEPEEAAVLASAFWKCCSARAQAQAGGRGPGSFRAALMDAAYMLTARDLLQADITALS